MPEHTILSLAVVLLTLVSYGTFQAIALWRDK